MSYSSKVRPKLHFDHKSNSVGCRLTVQRVVIFSYLISKYIVGHIKGRGVFFDRFKEIDPTTPIRVDNFKTPTFQSGIECDAWHRCMDSEGGDRFSRAIGTSDALMSTVCLAACAPRPSFSSVLYLR